jgi:hypothetical protein
LPLLSIDVVALAAFPEVAVHLPSGFTELARIDDVQLAIESLEVALVLGGGEVLVYRMADHQAVTARQLPDKRLVSLEHIPVADGLRFKPYFFVKADSPVTALAMSDVGMYSAICTDLSPYMCLPGFASIGYANGSLIVIDMRGPRVMFQAGKVQQTTQRHSLIHRNSPGTDPVMSLAWAITGVKSGMSSLYFLLESRPQTGFFCRRDAADPASCSPRFGARSSLYTCAS